VKRLPRAHQRPRDAACRRFGKSSFSKVGVEVLEGKCVEVKKEDWKTAAYYNEVSGAK
jgi:hypothetical protein